MTLISFFPLSKSAETIVKFLGSVLFINFHVYEKTFLISEFAGNFTSCILKKKIFGKKISFKNLFEKIRGMKVEWIEISQNFFFDFHFMYSSRKILLDSKDFLTRALFSW